MSFTYIRRAAVAFALLAATSSCTVKSTTPPALSGPSGLALTVTLNAIPDSISQDGGSQSSIKVTAIGPDGKGLPALPLRVDMVLNGVVQDFGTLSARSIVTDANGVATVVYTAPPSNGAFGTCNALPGNCVSIVATATGTNFSTANPEQVTIRLVPTGVILPPAGAPTAVFAMSPSIALMSIPVTFDASASTPGTGASVIASYAWNFGDGGTGIGRSVSHTFTSQQTFNVSLTVTNDRGLAATSTISTSVGAVGAPTPKFVFSPSTPQVAQTIVFNADQSTAAPGHTLAVFGWNFGDGSTASGSIASHAYATAGTFTVVLSVADEVGTKSTTSNAVAVSSVAGGGGGGTAASFVASPTSPVVGQVVFFNASGSTAATGHSLVKFAWDFGDGTTLNAVTATTNHTFTTVGAFTVQLVVTDDAGTIAKTTSSVTVAAAGAAAPTANFTFSPAAPGVAENVFFNAATSTASAGHTIASYAWTFGDGATGSGVAPTHAYSTAGSYGVQLKVTDEAGQATTSAPTTVPVGSPPSPTANFTFSPALPGRNDQVVFDASSSSTSQGQAIVDVAWNYGDGTAVVHCGTLNGNDPSCVNAGVTNRVSAHTFATAQTFVVNLVVTDSAGRTNSKNFPVTVAIAQPTVLITASPSSPAIGQTVSFNSNGTTYYPGSSSGTFAWTFGDNSAITAQNSVANPTHSYTAAGTYSVSLSVTDSKGRTGVGTVTVTVAAPAPPVAVFTPTATTLTAAGGTVFFDAGPTTTPSGSAIVNYRWNFGDGSAIVNNGVGVPTQSHLYAAAVGLKTYTVTLTVTDGNGLTNTTTGTVTEGP